MHKRIEIKTIFFLLLFSPWLLFFSGCTVVEKIDSLNGILEQRPADLEIGKLQQAEDTFFSGNYDQAREMYTEIMRESSSPIYRNSALYGLSSIAIRTAADKEALQEGLAMMQQWVEPGAEITGYLENPRMIAEALNSQVGLLECIPEIRYVTTKKKGELLKKHQEEIEELKETIKKLEHQISVLEAIDQEIQEKRKPI